MVLQGYRRGKKLGLIYREQKDINAGVEIITKENRQYFDISKPVNDALVNSRGEFASKNTVLDVWWFYKKVIIMEIGI